MPFDNIISMRTAATKGFASKVATQRDGLVAPDLEAGNRIATQLMYLAGAKATEDGMGAPVPIILTRRADDSQPRIAPVILAGLFNRALYR